MTEDGIHEALSDPNCPFTYEELWDMYFGPRGPSISDMIAQFEAEDRQDGNGPNGVPSVNPESN